MMSHAFEKRVDVEALACRMTALSRRIRT